MVKVLVQFLWWLIRLFVKPPIPIPPIPADDFVEELSYYHNKVREAQGISPLKLNRQLNAAAQKHADWMGENDKLTHQGDGTPAARISQEGYRWTIFGENVAFGPEKSAAVFIQWMKSRGHKSNILSKSYKDVGFGKSGRYWCAVFADRV